MLTVSKSVLKAKMLGLFREIEKTGEEMVVTDNRKPVLKIVPLKQKERFDEVFAEFKGKMRYTESLEESTEKEWNET